ncbi:unnamed protein product [Adineta steineri]|uniref:Uncharacterized protein n=1 Tax=Adineta steineri TaxID=433720 RepID=A0A819CKY1_9BILA|nr:unnamed protein product [Adineta steineri]CAF0887772.1 unnamed protein product [Adineta steineri]CAF3590199.1 unnamed protein product [Adineta steineri]CAF3817156.1 unnamed protein product [Adineta steineri]
MRRGDSDESLSYQNRADDRFFVISTAVLPFLAQAAYIFDVFYYHTHSSHASTGYGVGTIGHVIFYAKEGGTLHVVLYILWGIIDSIYFACLIYCRVFSKHYGLRVHMPIKQEHLFSFISRLELILAIFIPIFLDSQHIKLTRDNIAFYILFDFFAESYSRFAGIRMKTILYIFVVTVTASVTTEWIHIAKHEKIFDIASLICELVAACFCYSLIVMQFFPSNFKSKKRRKCKRSRKLLPRSSINTIQLSDNHTDDETSTDTNSENVSYF